MSMFNGFKSAPTKNRILQKNRTKVFSAVFVVAVISLGSTLAANINLNGSTPVEFGQGVAQATACDQEIIITPFTSFNNIGYEASAENFNLNQITVTDIDSSAGACDAKIFTIKVYGGNNLLNIYSSDGTGSTLNYSSIEVQDNQGTFHGISDALTDADITTLDSSDITSTGFTVNFSNSTDHTLTPLASSTDVTQITAETRDGSSEVAVDSKTYFGGYGGSPFELDCSAGYVATSVGIVPDSELSWGFEFTCTEVDANKSPNGATELKTQVGGASATYSCPAGKAMSGINVLSDTYVGEIAPICSTPPTGSGEVQFHTTVQYENGRYKCPAGRFIVGFTGRSGGGLDAVQATCAVL